LPEPEESNPTLHLVHKTGAGQLTADSRLMHVTPHGPHLY
jgi:hypothetical protein